MEQDGRLDLYGQLPSLNLYTQISLCYPIPNDDVSCHDIAAILATGLSRLSKDLPWLAGKIIHSSEDDKHPRTFQIVPHQSAPVSIARDLRNDPSVPTMQALRENRFPCRLLNENWLVAYTTFQYGRAGSSPEPTVVFAVQTHFIKGGVILIFVGHHQAMDMVGLGMIMQLLSRACKGDGLTGYERQVANMARYDLVPLIPDLEVTTTPQPEKPDTTPAANTNLDTSPPPTTKTWPPPCEWAYFSFSAASLARLKSVAMETRDRCKQPMWDISTDDALTAFIWKSVSRCRISRLSLSPATTQTPTKITRAVDMRRYLDLPPEYPGMMQTLAYHECETISKLHQLPLGVIASQLREAIHWERPGTKPQQDTKTELPLVHNARELATKIHRSISSGKGIEHISLVEGINPSTDLMISSWAKVNECYDLDFGMGLGKPEVVRRPGFTPRAEGLVYFLPKRPLSGDGNGNKNGNETDNGGEIVVMVCLRKDDLERLKGDEEFGKFGKYIG